MSNKSKAEDIDDAISQEGEIDITQQTDVNDEVEQSEEERLREDVAKEKDKFLRLFAEFENYKKKDIQGKNGPV